MIITGFFCFAGLILLVITCVGVFLKIDAKFAHAVLLLYSVAMVICAMGLAYLSAPYPGSDLSRYYNELNFYRMMGWQYSSQSLYSTTPLTCLFMYLIAQTGDFQLFPCISAGLAVGIWMLIVNDQARTYGLSTRVFFFGVASALTVNQILSLLIGGRQHLALCLLLLAVWYDLKPRRQGERKIPIVIALYIIPLLVHYGVVPIYLARLLLFVLEGRSSTVIAVSSIFAALLSGVVLQFLESSGIGGEYIAQVALKFFSYEEITVSDGRLMALSMATVLAYFMIGFLCHREMSKKGQPGAFQTMLFITLSLSAAFLTNYHLSERVLAFCLYGFYPMLLWIAGRRRSDKVIFFVFAAICLFLALHGAYQYVSIANQWILNLI